MSFLTNMLLGLTYSQGIDATGVNDNSKCAVGVTFTGLGQLSGDYLHRGQMGVEDYYGFYDKRRLGWNYLVRYDNADDNIYLSEADALRVKGKWTIIDGGTPSCGKWLTPTCKVLSVCASGCPDGAPLSGAKTAIWPESGVFSMQWEDPGGMPTSVANSSVVGVCCHRKPQRCDACDDEKTCGTVNVSSCPAGAHDQLARDCCMRDNLPACVCALPPTVCDHEQTFTFSGIVV